MKYIVIMDSRAEKIVDTLEEAFEKVNSSYGKVFKYARWDNVRVTGFEGNEIVYNYYVDREGIYWLYLDENNQYDYDRWERRYVYKGKE